MALAGETHDPVLERAFTRITGGDVRGGNAVRLLKDADENYPAWLEAIEKARTCILFENYIVDEDRTGRRFADALAERASQGVRVYFLYDWFGCFGRASTSFWAELVQAGVEVRTFNRFSAEAPLAWIRRNHRKVLAIDGSVAFVSGLCVSDRWLGDPVHGVEPWHDTGVELRGPVVADVVRAFAETWALTGAALPDAELPSHKDPADEVGSVTARIVAGRPGEMSAYRLDQFVAAAARRSLWLTDAYFVATTAYVRGLTDASRDGVDVRLLVPRSSDIRALKPLTRAGYRPLIEAGVRVFEWGGSMLHAKTAVADGAWVRIGSTNLNVASWLTNWELDVLITDAGFAQQMEEMYLADIAHATEVVLDPARAALGDRAPQTPYTGPHRGSASRIAAGAVGLGNAAGAAMAGARPLAPAEARAVATIGGVLLGAAAFVALLPWLLAAPFVLGVGGIGFALLLRAWKLQPRDGSGR